MDSSAGLTMHEELRSRGWLYLRELGSPSPELEAWCRSRPYHWGAARLSDGLVARAPSGRELLALVDALDNAAERGAERPGWVPAGLGYDPEDKRVTWPRVAPVRPVPVPRFPTPAEICEQEGHILSVLKPGTCGSCGGPYVVPVKGGSHV